MTSAFVARLDAVLVARPLVEPGPPGWFGRLIARLSEVRHGLVVGWRALPTNHLPVIVNGGDEPAHPLDELDPLVADGG